MARLVLAPKAAQDLRRLTEFLLNKNPRAASETVDVLKNGLSILKRHPLVGRSVEQDYRELVISRGHTGYVALYIYYDAHDVALVLAIRHQRECGFAD